MCSKNLCKLTLGLCSFTVTTSTANPMRPLRVIPQCASRMAEVIVAGAGSVVRVGTRYAPSARPCVRPSRRLKID